MNRCPCIMDSQSQLTASFRSFLNLAFICMDILSLSNMFTGDPSLSAYTSTQKATFHPGCNWKGSRSCYSGRCVRKVLFLLVLRGSILHWDTQWNRQHPVLTFWPTFLAQSFCLSQLQSKSKLGMDSHILRLLS